jgi:hypothetical protein
MSMRAKGFVLPKHTTSCIVMTHYVHVMDASPVIMASPTTPVSVFPEVELESIQSKDLPTELANYPTYNSLLNAHLQVLRLTVQLSLNHIIDCDGASHLSWPCEHR